MSAAHRILGIDPGLSGAVALLTSLGELSVADIPVLEINRNGRRRREIETVALVDLIRELKPSHAVIERVGAMPGQGVVSMFSFGRSLGQIEGVLAGLCVPVTYVAPVAWKRALSVPAGKDAARLRASQLLPAYAAQWRRAKDDGRAEASLIALWAFSNVPMLAVGAAA
jgi:crossover junction endodeoxyribonuclease RuvC